MVNLRMQTWALALLAVVVAVPAVAQSGADLYKSKCAMCHGPDGLANTPVAKSMKVPSFQSPDALKMSEGQLIEVTRNGKGKMPAYNGKLTDAQIKEVVAHIRELQKK